MRVATEPAYSDLTVGSVATVAVSVTNTSSTIDGYSVRVFGLDPQWVAVEPARLSLFPGDTGEVAVTIALPEAFPSGSRNLAVHVRSENDAEQFGLAQVALGVTPRPRASVTVDPTVITGGTTATFGLVVANTGNATLDVVPTAVDPEEKATVVFDPGTLVLPPGRRAVITARVSRPRPWVGQPKPRVLTFGIAAPDPIETVATFVQRPRIPRWLISLLGLALVAAVFALVLTRTFDRVVDEARVDQDLVLEALNQGGPGGETVPVNPAVVTGRVVQSTTGAGVAAAQVELFRADNGEVPVATAATTADGTYTFGRLGEGTYRIRFSGAGLDGLWYPSAVSFADAGDVEVVAGETLTLDDVTLAGQPGTIEGVLDIPDPSGTVITLVAPGTIDTGTTAVVGRVDVSADGSFSFPDVPSPATYQMIVEKPGYAPLVRDVVVGPGGTLDGLELVLQPGGGTIGGIVQGPQGRLGGVNVSATDGRTTITTVSLTEGDVGRFVLRGLATPGIYTVTIGRDGYTSESRTVTLTADQQVGDVVVTLQRAIGSISGRVNEAGVGGRGGVTVTVSGAGVEISTVTASQGNVGAWVVEDLPAPATYTVTFSAPGLVAQTLLTDLDPDVGVVDATGVDVALRPDTAVVRGVVRAVTGVPVALASVVLTDGRTSRQLTSVDDPLGVFEFSGVVPGVYTLTASLPGSSPSVVLVNVAAAQTASFDVVLDDQASLAGAVLLRDPDTGQVAPYPGAVVRLFEATDFPGPAAAAVVEAVTDAAGAYSFPDLAAPANFIVAVYSSPTSADPLDASLASTQPSVQAQVATFTIVSVF